MPRYFFDTHDGERFVKDDDGLEFDGITTARDEATRALAEMAKDVIPGSERRELSVQVRDVHRDLLRASLWFEVAILAA